MTPCKLDLGNRKSPGFSYHLATFQRLSNEQELNPEHLTPESSDVQVGTVGSAESSGFEKIMTGWPYP